MCFSRMARDGQGVCYKQATQEFGCGDTLGVSGNGQAAGGRTEPATAHRT